MIAVALAAGAGVCGAGALVAAFEARAAARAAWARTAPGEGAARTHGSAVRPPGAPAPDGPPAPGAPAGARTRRGDGARPDHGARPGHGAPARTRPPGGSLAAALGRLGRRAGLPIPAPGDLGRRISAAGLPPAVTADEVMAVKAGAALVGALAGFTLLLPAAPGRLGPVVALAAPAAAFLAPDLWLARRARDRAQLLALDLPDVLDLTRVAVAAGLPVVRALQAVGERRGGPLAAELTVCAALIELGVPRAQALARLAERAPLPGIVALVAAVQRTDRHGTPLGPALAALAADARTDHARRLQDRAARAAPKIQLAVALLLVPAAMLLLAAALLTSLR